MDYTENLLKLLKKGKTQFHVVDCIEKIYENAGYSKLKMDELWKLEKGKKYYVKPFSSCFFAINLGNEPDKIVIAASHTDFPMLKLKSNPEIKKKGYLLANVEPYGGLLVNTWFDRPLGLAGKIVLKGKDVFSPSYKLYDSKKALFIISSLAPHLKREQATEKLDIAKEIVPLMGLDGKEVAEKYILEYIANDMKLDVEDILDYDLYLYNMDVPQLIGMDEELVASPRIDNISSVAAIACAMTGDKENKDKLSIGAFFDNEEIGSRSKQGADSILLNNIIERIVDAVYRGENAEKQKTKLLNNIFTASLDVAHGLHPNYTEKSDITNEVILGKGIVLKVSAAQKYVSDSEAAAVITSICRGEKIKYQRQVNKSGMAGGQTLGPIMSSFVPSMAADLGIPILAMHSACEVAALKDFDELVKITKELL